MYKHDNIEIMIGIEEDEIIEKLLKSFLQNTKKSRRINEKK